LPQLLQVVGPPAGRGSSEGVQLARVLISGRVAFLGAFGGLFCCSRCYCLRGRRRVSPWLVLLPFLITFENSFLFSLTVHSLLIFARCQSAFKNCIIKLLFY
jgi:hypothetical protein